MLTVTSETAGGYVEKGKVTGKGGRDQRNPVLSSVSQSCDLYVGFGFDCQSSLICGLSS